MTQYAHIDYVSYNQQQINGKQIIHYIYIMQSTRTKSTSTLIYDRIGGVMIIVLASSGVVRWFEPRSDQTKDYKMCMCCFSAKHEALRRKSKYWLARNQDNVVEWGDISIRALLFQCVSTLKITLCVLAQYKADLIIVSLNTNLFLS